MNEYFPHLFEPIKIGKTTVKNRIFMLPISTNMADKGYVMTPARTGRHQ